MIFKQQIKEHLIADALDTLVENGYVRSYVDEEGVTQLYRWYELDDVLEEIRKEKEDDAS